MKGKSGIIAIILLVLLAGAALFFTVDSDSPEVITTNDVALTETASDGLYMQNLKDLDGNPIAMDPNKVIFMNVWATWCGPCNIEMPSIQNLYSKFKDNDKVQFLIVSDEDASIVTPFIARKGYQLPFYQYEGVFPQRLDGNAIPRTYIIHNGNVIREGVGAEQWDSEEVITLIENAVKSI